MGEEHNYTRGKPYRRYKSNNICSVPQCSNRCTSEISLHTFPQTGSTMWKKWITSFKMVNLPKIPLACSKHFTDNDFKISLRGKGKCRRLKPTAVPSVNLPKGSLYKSPSSAKKIKMREREERFRRRLFEGNEMLNNNVTDDTAVLATIVDELNEVTESQPEVREHFYERTDETCDRQDQGICVDMPPLNATIQHVITTDAGITNCTGLPSLRHFNALCRAAETVFVAMGFQENGMLLDVEGRILMTLMKFKLNLSCICLASFFRIDDQTCIDHLFSTIDVLYFILKPMIKWPSREQVDKNIPKHFFKYPHTRVVLDCTEVPVMKLDCLNDRMRTYSHYKEKHTIKFMAGVSPCGLITFVSDVYGGRASDKLIFNQSKLVELCDIGDGVMVDKGFPIEQECNAAGLQLIRPLFLEKKRRFTASEAEHNRYVSRARVHVERAFQRVKNFRILKQEVHRMFLPDIDKIVCIISGLVNLSKPILKDDSFIL